MLRKSTAEESVGCLFSVIGMGLGPVVLLTFAPPPRGGCGLPAVGGAFIGMFFGALCGAVVGMIIGRLLPAPTPGMPISKQSALQKLQCEEKGGCLWGIAGGAMGFLIGMLLETDLFNPFHATYPSLESPFYPMLRAGGLLIGTFLGIVLGIVYRHWVDPSDEIVPPIAKHRELPPKKGPFKLIRSTLRIPCERFEIEIVDDRSETNLSANGSDHNEREYRLDDEREIQPSTRHLIRVLSQDSTVESASCLLVSAGGITGIHEQSAFVHGETLVVAVGPFIAALRLPTLELLWKTKVDLVACYGVYHAENQRWYLAHGEICIAWVSYAGEMAWTRGGEEILTNGFSLTTDSVTAIDWNGKKYRWSLATGDPLPTKSS